jgi:hypothetical protein
MRIFVGAASSHCQESPEGVTNLYEVACCFVLFTFDGLIPDRCCAYLIGPAR